MRWTDVPAPVLARLRAGTVIPAPPPALDPDRRFDGRRQRALARYYLGAGAGGLAAGVAQGGALYRPALEAAAEIARAEGGGACVLIADLAGPTEDALAAADLAQGLGYHVGLLRLDAVPAASEDDLVAHCRRLAGAIPLVGWCPPDSFHLGRSFWRRFAEIENIVAIAIGACNRYRTLDIVAGVVAAQAEDRVAIYTGNQDHVLLDLIAPFALPRDGGIVEIMIRGGMLGHWGVWTKTATGLFERAHAAAAHGPVSREFLALDSQITDCNSAFFDAANGGRGRLAGIREVLRRQGLLEAPGEDLSPGQRAEIDRVYAAYPHLNDDTFVAANRARWLEA